MIDFKEGHSGNVNSIIEVSDYIWTCSSDKTIRVWTPDTADCVKILTGHTGPIYSLRRVGAHVWSISWDKNVILWDGMVRYFIVLAVNSIKFLIYFNLVPDVL